MLIAFILLCQAAGVAGSLLTIPSLGGWYASLNKPSFSPPDWIFGPVWIALYTLMGISAYIIWEKKVHKEHVRHALYLFGIQLAETMLWSALFFYLHSPFYGLLCMIFLWISIVLTIACFYMLDRRAAYLLIPYFLWVSFAMVLNFSIWRLNPALDAANAMRLAP